MKVCARCGKPKWATPFGFRQWWCHNISWRGHRWVSTGTTTTGTEGIVSGT